MVRVRFKLSVGLFSNFGANFGVWDNCLQFQQPSVEMFAFPVNYIFRACIKYEKVNDLIEDFAFCEFLEC